MIALALALSGCGTSKWAMDDPDYRAKYDGPYQGDEKIPRMLKQSVDARYVDDKSGLFLGFAGAGDPRHAGAEIGMVHFIEPWLEGRMSLAGLASSPANDFFGGINTGLRIQSPSRVAPFVGVGTFAGFSKDEIPAENDGRDNDNNGFIDELGETRDESDTFFSVYPEFGVHAWLTAHTRLTGSISYHVSSEGRDADFVFYGLGMTWLWGGEDDEDE